MPSPHPLALIFLLLAAVWAAGSAGSPGVEDSSAQVWQQFLYRQGLAAPDQSVSFGTLTPYDRVLSTKIVYVPSTVLQVHEQTITFSLSSGAFTFIRLDDLLKTGKNAEVKIKSGGPGFRDVAINLKSLRGEKINYNVILYGR